MDRFTVTFDDRLSNLTSNVVWKTKHSPLSSLHRLLGFDWTACSAEKESQTKLGAEDQKVLAAIKARSEDLTQAFKLLMRERRLRELEPCFQFAKSSGRPDFVTFARGPERDAVALKAALLLPWSDGPVEGMLNKIKRIKRRLYGQASFQLLRQRVLMAV